MTNKRRYLISAAVFVAGVCIALGVLAMLPPRPNVLRDKFERIHIGMTLMELEVILGPYVGGVESPLWVGNNKFGGGIVRWSSADNAQIEVELDTDNVAIRKEFQPSTDTIATKLRRWLRIQ